MVLRPTSLRLLKQFIASESAVGKSFAERCFSANTKTNIELCPDKRIDAATGDV
ncbi:hypothetical protein ASAP_0059 [Asaia bogorensis]|uniref:Uncharacterized protein n=1 Tax=Asaia bogorensis TaxID=91915 RepID=A0A060QAH6_9PROT|nr:hypothetical protein ASAP_0059 [Asaia bogorensis]